MKKKRNIGIILIILGVVLLGFSQYIKKQVADGKLEVASAQRKVQQGSRLFDMSPVTREVGKGITGSAERRIHAGQQQIDYYSNLANVLQIGGIICIVAGLGVIVIGKKKTG